MIAAMSLVPPGKQIPPGVLAMGVPVTIKGDIAGTPAEFWVKMNPVYYPELAQRHRNGIRPDRALNCARMTQQTPPAGWYADPSGKHEKRYFDGQKWTEHVNSHGRAGIDMPSGGPSHVPDRRSGRRRRCSATSSAPARPASRRSRAAARCSPSPSSS